MRAQAVVVAIPGIRTGDVRYTTLRSDPPLLLRPTPAGLHLLGGAAGPLGGDRLDLEVVVEAGAHLTIRSAAASLVLPGASPSDVRVRASVAPGASLDWAPEPTISVRGSRHRQRAEVRVAEGGRVSWTETLVLGRTGEPGGDLDAGLRIEHAGRPVVHQQLGCGAGASGWDGVASMNANRVASTVVAVGVAAHGSVTGHDEATGARGMRVALESDVSLAQAVAADAPAAAAMLASLAIRSAPG
ncbi:MAG: urease accessory protein UreD [Actinomycetota bacterium]